GLSAFVGREIEYETDRADRSDIVFTVGGLATYLIEHGPVVRDGNTFGASETERLTARHVESRRHPAPPVRLARGTVGGGAPWTGRLQPPVGGPAGGSVRRAAAARRWRAVVLYRRHPPRTRSALALAGRRRRGSRRCASDTQNLRRVEHSAGRDAGGSHQ